MGGLCRIGEKERRICRPPLTDNKPFRLLCGSSDSAVDGVVDQQQQLQYAAEALLPITLHPGQGALPAGVLTEHDPQREGSQPALHLVGGGRRIGFHTMLLRGEEYAVGRSGLRELQFLQQGVHFPDELHCAVEGNFGIQIGVANAAGQDPVMVIVDTDQRCLIQFVAHGF